MRIAGGYSGYSDTRRELHAVRIALAASGVLAGRAAKSSFVVDTPRKYVTGIREREGMHAAASDSEYANGLLIHRERDAAERGSLVDVVTKAELAVVASAAKEHFAACLLRAAWTSGGRGTSIGRDEGRESLADRGGVLAVHVNCAAPELVGPIT